MTKIGEGNQPPKGPDPHRDLEVNAFKFENALEAYAETDNSDDKTRLKAFMDDHLALIQKAVNGIKFREINKQSEKVSKDYEQYITTRSDESYSALQHDVQTLRDYNQASTPKEKGT